MNTKRNFADDAWLGLGDISKLKLSNPFDNIRLETLGLGMVELMCQPQYLQYTAKVLLNVDLLPEQAAILEELWVRPFPMYIASRGFGKTARDVYIVTDNGFCLINNIFKDEDPYNTQIPLNCEVQGETGFRKPQYGWKKKAHTIKLTTSHGFYIEGSEIHPVRVVDNGKIVWKELQQLTQDDKIVIDRNADDTWFENTNGLPPDLAYLFGCLVGDGGYTKRGNITITSADPELATLCSDIARKYWNKGFNKQSSKKYDYLLSSVKVWDELFQEYGFNSSVCAEKDFPASVLSASRHTVAAFIRGLFDTDGCIGKTKKLWMEYASKSKNLVRTLQFVLSRFGIISRVKKRHNKKYDRDYYYLYIFGENCKLFYDRIGFGLARKQDLLESQLNIETNANLDVLPHSLVLHKLLTIRDTFVANYIFGGHGYNRERQLIAPSRLKAYHLSYSKFKEVLDIFGRVDACKEMVEYQELLEIYNQHYFYDSVKELGDGYNDLYDFYIPEDHSYLSGGFISHNSWLLAVLAMLKCILTPGHKVVIVGGAFRQSKIIFEYMESIWSKAPVLRSICGSRSGPRRDTDRCTMYINDSWAIAIPLGDGGKIRGLRAHTILADEFDSIPPDIYETVVSGFAAVSSSPVENVKAYAKRKVLQEAGTWTEAEEQTYQQRTGNQAILSGTASYGFKHFADYWRRYKMIVKSKGDPEKIKEIYGDNEIPEHFDWRDYSIIRVPYDLLPKGFMDDKIIARAKGTVHEGIYHMEYGACVGPDTLIITDSGTRKIIDINIGDKVLTHKGRFQPVTKKTCRYYNGEILQYKTQYCYDSVLVTPDHPFWVGDKFKCLTDQQQTFLSPLKQLSSLTEVFVNQYVDNYIEREGYIYPRGSKNLFDTNEINDILTKSANGNTPTQIAREMNAGQSRIYSIIHQKRPKNAINSCIALNYNIGLILGYYASEGSCGANGRAVEFSLDGHVNVKFDQYISELSRALESSIGVKPKLYGHKDNVCRVVVNSRVFVDFVKKLCPGICYNKLIQHDILFSNKQLLKGFIVGMFNGDGHCNERFGTIQLTNLNLLIQLRLALSFFGIHSSILKPKNRKHGYIKGKRVKYAQVYKLTIYGDHYRKFRSLFYYDDSIKHNVVDVLRHNIVEKTSIPYNDFVYNLEVEQDNSYSLLNTTVHNCFSDDSNGFFKRSLIESCVTSDKKPVPLHSGDVWFDAKVRGSSEYQYVYGLDPASEKDNFSLIILELHRDHTRIVYGWSTTRASYKKRIQIGLTHEHDFYAFCCRKIRDLMKVFPCARIGCDSQGGGVAIEEAFQDPDKLKDGEQVILPIIDPEKKKDTDHLPGLHILELVHFAKADWTSEANHGLKKDFEDKVLLFPRFDPLTLEFAMYVDKNRMTNIRSNLTDAQFRTADDLHLYDTLEDCVLEIEELKDELCTITHSIPGQKVGSRERWDVPEKKLEGGKKGPMRKDRYSALLIANMLARQIHRTLPTPEYTLIGGVTTELAQPNPNMFANAGQKMYAGNCFLNQSDFIPVGINRG